MPSPVKNMAGQAVSSNLSFGSRRPAKMSAVDNIWRNKFTNPTPNVEYLVVAGGGTSGVTIYQYGTGSGGGGGFRSSVVGAASGGGAGAEAVHPVVSGVAHTITVGASGADSAFDTIISKGGGSSGGYTSNGTTGGSGGSGSGGTGTSGGAGTANQGYAGGGGSAAQGSGGAGGAGGAGETSGSGTAGVGLASSITGASVTYAKGGSRGWDRTLNPNSGDGGMVTSSHIAGLGDAGIVVIRYADTFDLATSTTGSPTITTAGGFHVYKFTGSGSITI